MLNFCHDRLTEKKSIFPKYEYSNIVFSTRARNDVSPLSSSSSSSSLEDFFVVSLQQHLRKISAKIAKHIKLTQSNGNAKRLTSVELGAVSKSKVQLDAIRGSIIVSLTTIVGTVVIAAVVLILGVVFGTPHLQPRQSYPCSLVRPSQLFSVGNGSIISSQV